MYHISLPYTLIDGYDSGEFFAAIAFCFGRVTMGLHICHEEGIRFESAPEYNGVHIIVMETTTRRFRYHSLGPGVIVTHPTSCASGSGPSTYSGRQPSSLRAAAWAQGDGGDITG